jgi:tetratricopeptide (TPR) repeat protein
MRHILSAPIVMALALAIPALAAGPAAAQSAASKSIDDAVTEHYNQGAKAAEAGQWDKARAAFLEAWKLKPHYQIAANLGNAELMSRRYRDAAEHLRFFLREAPADVDAVDRRKAEQLFTEAKAKIGAVSVQVDLAGAEVTVDGAPVGISPLREPVFVDPGEHTFEARLGGHAPVQTPIVVPAGSSPQVTLRLVKPSAPTAGPQPPGSTQPVGSVQPPGSAQVPAGPGPQDGGGVPKWKPWAIGGGAVLAAAGIGVGIGFTFMSKAKESEANDIIGQLLTRAETDETICAPAQNKELCDELWGVFRQRDNTAAVAVVGYTVGGAAAIGTVLLAVLPRNSPKGSTGVRVTPILAPGHAGAVLTGSF